MPNNEIPERGLISRMMAKLFGASWATAFSGYLTLVAYAIHEKPEWIQWMSEPYRGFVWSWSEWLAIGGAIAFANRVKTKTVTGGSQQQTLSGARAEPGTQTLVDQTVVATIKSGEQVTPEQKEAVKP